MLKRIKDYVEKRINRQVSTKELEAALEDAKNNITCNYLLLGYDVTAKQFLDILINCVKIRLKLAPATYNTSSDTLNSILNSIVVLDQGGQVKRITSVTILDYNPTILFDITIDGKKDMAWQISYIPRSRSGKTTYRKSDRRKNQFGINRGYWR